MIFRRTDKYGYSRYYGGGGPAFVIKVVVSLLLVAALVIGGAAFAMQRYMVYTENGGHLEFPWDKPAAEEGNAGEGDPLDALVVTGEESAEQSAESDGSASAEQSAESDGSASAEQSAESDGSASAEQSAESDGSASTEQSAEADASASAGASEPAVPGETKPGVWARIAAWFKNLFRAPEPVIQPQSSEADVSGTEAEESGSASADPADGEKSQGDASESAPAEQSEEKKSEPAALPGGALIQHVSIGDVTAGYAEGDIKNANGTGIMLYMKESGGRLNYVSGQEIADELDASTEESTSEKVAKTIRELKEDGYYTLAYVDCFQDQRGGEKSEYSLYDEGGSPWYDGEERAWVDPTNEAFQDYLIGIIKELADMGFDEIALNNACYPATGDTSILSDECYNPEEFEKTVTDFYKKVAKAMKKSDVMISVLTSETAITEGSDPVTGQTLKNMKKLGGRLWVDADRDDAEKLEKALKEAGYPDNTLGLLVGKLDSDSQRSQMNLD